MNEYIYNGRWGLVAVSQGTLHPLPGLAEFWSGRPPVPWPGFLGPSPNINIHVLI